MLGEDGKPLNALKLVESLSKVSGILMTKDKNGNEVQSEEGSAQFRLLVTLKPGAIETLDKSKEFDKSVNAHVYKDGEVQKGEGTLRSGGFLKPGIQVSFLKDRRTADIDVDYNGGLSGNHGQPGNSDIQTGDNLQKHNKMFGKENPLRNIPRRREYKK